MSELFTTVRQLFHKIVDPYFLHSSRFLLFTKNYSHSFIICSQGLCNKAEYTQRLNGILHILDRKNRLEEKVKQMQKLSPLASNPSSSRFLKIEEAESTVVGNSYCNVEDSTYSMSVRKGGLVLKFLALEDPLFCIQHIMNTLKL